ncbi:carbonic anhydrase 6 [Echinops telfairi]|uniref:Carbonic anhydrase n=1 Tax=Echinops telfairi TaxID=9371 RepID=A0ABM0IQL7_ECHTE|nr:carbonic anhydrase 6 [Echinops telfairi]
MRAVAILLSLFLGVSAQHGSQWSYSEGALDQERWAEQYPTCGGKRQSPINLQKKLIEYNPTLKGLNLVGYEAQNLKFSMINNGHTVQISLPQTMHMTTADGTVYMAQQMHFHWGGGSSEMRGSEHTIDKKRYMIEAHVVHYNSNYKNYDVAKDHPDGLAVLAFFFVESHDDAENPHYTEFLSHLKNIRYPGQSTTLSGFDIKDMLPRNLQDYYTYHGSLTTPPCTENVLWFLLAEPVKLPKKQILKLENSLLDNQNKTLQNAYRLTQPLNDRVVQANFEHFSYTRSE